MLDIPKASLFLKLRKDGMTLLKNPTPMLCELCEMKETLKELKTDRLLSMVRLNSEKDTFECSLCNHSGSNKLNIIQHIREKHREEVKVAKKQPSENQN